MHRYKTKSNYYRVQNTSIKIDKEESNRKPTYRIKVIQMHNDLSTTTNTGHSKA